MLEYCSTVWNPYIPARHYLGMTDQVEKVQRNFSRRVYQRCQLDCNHSYLQRLAYLEIESLELRRIYQDLAMVHKIVRGLITADLKRHFPLPCKHLIQLCEPEVTLSSLKQHGID